MTEQRPDGGALEGQLFAAVDLGSNSFHMLVAKYEHGTLNIIDRLKEMVRLAAGVAEDGSLQVEVGQRALDCLSRFGQRLRDIPEPNIVAVGTNAMRRIRGFDFIDQAERALDQPIQIISGEEEARLIYHGVAHGISQRNDQRLVIDIGGGSTEFVIGKSFEPIMLESLYFGCVSTSQRFFADGRVTERRWTQARTWVAQELQRIASDYRACGWQEALGSSGTMKSVRNVCVGAGFSERGITAEAMSQLRTTAVAAGHIDKLVLPGLSERRRPVFAGGAVVIDACIQELGIKQILVTDYALREGLLYQLLGLILRNDPRNGTVDALIARYHIDRSQAQGVSNLALNLFDQVASSWRLSTAARDVLHWAALLHEVGLTISHHGYHQHGAYLLRVSDLPGFSRLEQQLLSALVGNHRRRPDPQRYDAVISRARQDARYLTALLRLAFLFCRTRSSEPLPTVQVQVDPDTIRLSVDDRWLAENPLTEADLVDEQQLIAGLDLELILTG